MSAEKQTIDKVAFKVNIPILVGIIIATATVLGGYYNLLSGIAKVQVDVAKVYATVEGGNTQNKNDHQAISKIVEDHEQRIRVLEKAK